MKTKKEYWMAHYKDAEEKNLDWYAVHLLGDTKSMAAHLQLVWSGKKDLNGMTGQDMIDEVKAEGFGFIKVKITKVRA